MIPSLNELEASLPIERASSFARLALACITREYPNAPGQVLNEPSGIQSPRSLHPAFYGCFDWHSSVHSHWLLVRLLRLFPSLPESNTIRAALNTQLTAANLLAEASYLDQPNHQSFERPYGWAWLLKLAEELHVWDNTDGQAWLRNLEPLVRTIVRRYKLFFPKLTYPLRVGTHPNTAFGLALALDYTRTVGENDLESLIVERSRTYFSHDTDYPAAWEPNGGDFFSPSLIEADLMCRVLSSDELNVWFNRFLPQIEKGEPHGLLYPVEISDRGDPQLGHLDGLHLSRAWCMRRIASTLPPNARARTPLFESAARHAEAGLAHIVSGNYMGEHWLASFAVYLLSTSTAVNSTHKPNQA